MQSCDAWLPQGIDALRRDIGAYAGGLAEYKETCGTAQPEASLAANAVAALHVALLQGQFAAALEICHNFRIAQRHDKTAVYLQLLLPTITELGLDWSEDRVGFEQIAFAYSVMHNIIESLGRKNFFDNEHRKALRLGRVIVAVAPADTHDFGARILMEYLTLRGWDVTFIDGSNPNGITSALQHQPVDALALSVSTDTAFVDLADMIAEWRETGLSQHMAIIVGGAAILSPRDQYSFLQADYVGLSMDEVSEYLLTQVTRNRHGRWNLA